MFKKSLILLFFAPFFLQAQQSKKFKIIGESDYYNNRNLVVAVGLYPLLCNDCTLAANKTDSAYNPRALVQNRRFELFGTLRYPHPLIVSYYDAEKNQGQSSYFYFIEGGDVHISVDDLAKNKFLQNDINSKSNQEYRRLKKFYSGVVDTLTGRISDMQAKEKLMHAYIAAHPNSYVALWDQLFDYSYASDGSVKRSILENIQLFAPPLKKSKTYQALLNYLKKDMDLVVGRPFPDINLQPSLSIKAIAKENKFTLLDFWASWCKPCLKEMPRLKKVYTSYKGKGFSIIGISVDKKEKQGAWQKLIQQFNMDWPQYRDINAREAERINVNGYPGTFLLDEKGVIIKEDLSPEELTVFLEENLNK